MWPAPVERAFSASLEALRAAGLPVETLAIARRSVDTLRDAGYRDTGVLCAALLFGTTTTGISEESVRNRFGDYVASVVTELETRPTPDASFNLSRPARVVLLARIIAELESGIRDGDQAPLGGALAALLGPYDAKARNLVQAFRRA